MYNINGKAGSTFDTVVCKGTGWYQNSMGVAKIVEEL